MGRKPNPNGAISITKEYKTFSAIRQRCDDRKCFAYRDYGARGIKCMYKDLNDFISDIGYAPAPQYTIERIDNNGNYERGNCKWATTKEQSRNKRSNVNITVNGVTKIQSDWAKELKIPVSTLHNRIIAGSPNPLVSVKKNWSIEKSLNKYRARFQVVKNKVKDRVYIGSFDTYNAAESACIEYVKKRAI